MNVTLRKSLMVAVATTMGILPGISVHALPVNDLSSTTAKKTVYMPAEGKEVSLEYHNTYAGYDNGFADFDPAAATLAEGGDLDAYIYTMPGYPVSANKTLTVRVTLTNGAKFIKTPFLYCSHSAQGGGAGGVAGAIPNGVSAAIWEPSVDADSLATNVTANPAAALTVTAYKLIPTNQTTKLASYTFIFPEGFVVSEEGSGACVLSYTPDVGATTIPAGTPPEPGATEAVIQGGAAGQNIEMKAEVTYDDFFGKVTKTATIPLITFVTAYKAEFSKGSLDTPAEMGFAQIDVVKSSKQFLKDNVNSTKAFVGSFIVTAVDDTRAIRTITGSLVNASAIISTASVTINGTTVGTLGKIGLKLGETTDCDVAAYTLSGVPAGSTTTSGTSGSTTTQAGSVTIAIERPTVGSEADTDAFNVVSGTDDVASHTAMYVCLEADPAKTMQDGPLTVTFNATSPSGATFELGSGDLTTVTRNGAVLRILNIPSTTNADQSFIRFYNTSGQDIIVTGTLYGQDGKALSKEGAELVSPLKAYDVKALSASALASQLAITTPWPGRAWLLVQAPVDPSMFKVQALVRSPNGTLVNVSTDAMD
jgi:hypothetical protein